MRDILVTFIIFIGCVYTLKRPYIGILLFSWIGYMNPHRLGWGFARDFPFAYIVAIITIISLVLFNKDTKSFPKTGLTFVWFLFLFWMTLTTIFAIYPDVAIEQLIKVYKIQLFIILSLLFLGSIEKLNQLIWVIVISLCYFGVKGGVFTVLHGGSFIVWGPPGTFIEGNNELALAILMVIPLMNYLRIITDNKWIKRGLFVGMPLMGASALGSQSRGAFLAGGAMLGLLWLKSNNKAVGGIVAVIFSGVLLLLMSDSWHTRMGTIDNYEEDNSAMGRINAWQAAINLAKDRFMGGGFDGINSISIFKKYAPNPLDYHDSHSIYFEVLGDHGFVGLTIFMLIGLLAWKMCSGVIKDTKNIESLSYLNTLAKMLQVSLVAYAAGGAFLGLAYFDLYYHLIVMILLCRYLVDQYKIQKNNIND